MFEIGEIVYHENLRFADGNIDKKEKRPCIVLLSISKDDNNYICTIPLTSAVKSFNRNPYEYCFIPEIICSYKKFSFAKLENVDFHTTENTHSMGIHCSNQTVISIINKIKLYEPNDRIKQKYNTIKNYLKLMEQIHDDEEKNNKDISKREKKLKRKIAKMRIN